MKPILWLHSHLKCLGIKISHKQLIALISSRKWDNENFEYAITIHNPAVLLILAKRFNGILIRKCMHLYVFSQKSESPRIDSSPKWRGMNPIEDNEKRSETRKEKGRRESQRKRDSNDAGKMDMEGCSL